MSVETAERLVELISRVALGERAAFKTLYEICSARLNGVAYRIVDDIDMANEITQEAFIQIWNKSQEYNQHLSQPMTWMTSIVRYRAYDRVRAEKVRLDSKFANNSTSEIDIQPTRERHFEESYQLTQELGRCLDELNFEQRESIVMAYYYGFSREELAQHYSRSINSIKSWLRRGLMRLEECLKN